MTARLSTETLEFQERDLALLSGLFESRVMTADHISALHFASKRAYTTKRLRKLKAAGYIADRTRRVNQPSIYFLTRKGYGVLKERDLLSGYPPLGEPSFERRADVSEFTLQHELDIMDVKAAFHTALGQSEKHSILAFNTWPLLYQFEVSRPGRGSDSPVKPDGFIRIHEDEPGTKGFHHDCFLEVDRSSKDQTRLVNQAACYFEYFRSGDYAVRNGASPSEFEKYWFRVLMVVKSAERRNNTAQRLLDHNPPIRKQVWLTTFEEVTRDPLGPIWVRPLEYREATKGSPYENIQPMYGFNYRREPRREAFVESRIQKLRFLDSPPRGASVSSTNRTKSAS